MLASSNVSCDCNIYLLISCCRQDNHIDTRCFENELQESTKSKLIGQLLLPQVCLPASRWSVTPTEKAGEVSTGRFLIELQVVTSFIPLTISVSRGIVFGRW